MALDLTLCIVPKQVDAIFKKGLKNADYAEWISFIPTMLFNENFEDFENDVIIGLKKEVQQLKHFYQYSELDRFYDQARCSSTLDYLINTYINEKKLNFQENFIWDGGNNISDRITGSQGIPIRLYDHIQIKNIHNFLTKIDFAAIITFYNYEKMKTMGVYKLKTSVDIPILEKTFEKIKYIFNQANQNEHLLILKKID